MEKMHRTNVMLTKKQIDFLDEAANDFRQVSGKRITRGAIIRTAIEEFTSIEAGYRYAVIEVRTSDERKRNE